MNQTDSLKETVAINPATGEVLGHSPLHSVDDVKAAVTKARPAQHEWAKLPLKKRIKKLHAVRDYLVKHADDLSETISKDNGKVRLDALAAEVLPAAMALNYYSKNARRFLRPKGLGTGNIALINKRSKMVRVPFGVIGIISPWNYPFSIAFSEVVMGLLAGNAVLLKTASETQMVGLALKKSFESAGLPDGLFCFLNLPGRVAGDAFLDSGIDKLFFTGSVPVGKYLMKKASTELTPVCLELGGNDAMIVCKDADLQRAATGAVWAGFSNSGQSCGGVERIYVHTSVYQSFIDILKIKIEKLRVGYDRDFSVDMGAMTTQKQATAVKQHIEDAVAAGAQIYAQSTVPPSEKYQNFIPARVLTEVNHNMDIMKHETFGPVVGVMKVDSDEEAIRLANDSYLGLTGSVWSKNSRKAEKIARQIKAGAVTINDHLMSHGLPETAWGGFKQSSLGRSHGELGFNEMTQPQMIVHDLLPGVKKNMWWPPYNKTVYDGMLGLMDMLYARGIFRRIKGLFALIRVFPRTFVK